MLKDPLFQWFFGIFSPNWAPKIYPFSRKIGNAHAVQMTTWVGGPRALSCYLSLIMMPSDAKQALKKKMVDQNLGGARACWAPSWIRHCTVIYNFNNTLHLHVQVLWSSTTCTCAEQYSVFAFKAIIMPFSHLCVKPPRICHAELPSLIFQFQYSSIKK